MFNDHSSLLAHLATRRSGKPRDMIAPGPNEQEMRAILSLSLRTPDHGKLAPWRIVEIATDQRPEFAALLKKAWIAANPGAADLNLSALDQFAFQAPNLVVMLSTPVVESKVPVWEQQLAAGAAAMNLLHAAHAHGYVGSWLTGWAAFDPMVKAAFGGGPKDQIVGYFFFGSPAQPLEERDRPDYDHVVSQWKP
ncbi:MAG TPA: nitroreductase [Sphingopyxis sp.]|nr:nitroreductase [Sphingopyxis sp.]